MTSQQKAPRSADEQSSPEPERMITPDEEAGMDLAELSNPPQAEGQRNPGGGEQAQGEPLWRDRRKNEGAD